MSKIKLDKTIIIDFKGKVATIIETFHNRRDYIA